MAGVRGRVPQATEWGRLLAEAPCFVIGVLARRRSSPALAGRCSRRSEGGRRRRPNGGASRQKPLPLPAPPGTAFSSFGTVLLVLVGASAGAEPRLRVGRAATAGDRRTGHGAGGSRRCTWECAGRAVAPLRVRTAWSPPHADPSPHRRTFEAVPRHARSGTCRPWRHAPPAAAALPTRRPNRATRPRLERAQRRDRHPAKRTRSEADALRTQRDPARSSLVAIRRLAERSQCVLLPGGQTAVLGVARVGVPRPAATNRLYRKLQRVQAGCQKFGGESGVNVYRTRRTSVFRPAGFRCTILSLSCWRHPPNPHLFAQFWHNTPTPLQSTFGGRGVSR